MDKITPDYIDTIKEAVESMYINEAKASSPAFQIMLKNFEKEISRWDVATLKKTMDFYMKAPKANEQAHAYAQALKTQLEKAKGTAKDTISPIKEASYLDSVLKQQADSKPTVFTVETVDKAVEDIKKGVKAPWVNAKKSTLGGARNVAILVWISMQDQKDWKNGIIQNSPYLTLDFAGNGTIEYVSGKQPDGKKFRKVVVKSVEEAITKINKALGV